MKKVDIIGGSGFIGSYITKLFLENGNEVKVSSTNISKTEKYQHLLNLENAANLEICALNVKNIRELEVFANECEILIHGRTQFQLDVQDPKTELFDPTIKGAENFLEVVQQSKTIKKVIFIASVAAYNTNFPLPAGGKTPTDTFSENDTPFMSEEGYPYAQAKFIANQTVEKFIKETPKLSFEITSVSPVAVMGKSLSNREDSTSIGLHGKNYLLSSETYSVSDISLMLNGLPPKHKAKIIYQNAKASREFGIPFQPAIGFLKTSNS